MSERKVRARLLHDLALELALKPGRERDANIISMEASRMDREADQESGVRGERVVPVTIIVEEK